MDESSFPRGPAIFRLILNALAISVRLFACGKPPATPTNSFGLHRPLRWKLRFRVPSSHQLKRSLRLFQSGCNCEYLERIVDFTCSSATERSLREIAFPIAAQLVQQRYANRERRREILRCGAQSRMASGPNTLHPAPQREKIAPRLRNIRTGLWIECGKVSLM